MIEKTQNAIFSKAAIFISQMIILARDYIIYYQVRQEWETGSLKITYYIIFLYVQVLWIRIPFSMFNALFYCKDEQIPNILRQWTDDQDKIPLVYLVLILKAI